MAAVPSIGRASRVEAGAAPEADATRALYERYGNQIFGYCLHQLGSREEAEDAVQSTFLNAFRGLRRGVVPEAEQAWLFKIAQNVCLSRRRSSWRRGRIESPSDFELAEETAAAPARRADELIGLQDVLENMPENQRRAILLREWQGLSYREIAKELELSQAAVETLIFRARRALAQGLEASPAEQRSWRARLRPTLSLSTLASWLQSLFGSGLAVKAAGTAAVVAVGSAVVSGPVPHPHAPAASVRTQAMPARTSAWTPPPLSLRPAAASTPAVPPPAPARVPLRHTTPLLGVTASAALRRTPGPAAAAATSAASPAPAAAATAPPATAPPAPPASAAAAPATHGGGKGHDQGSQAPGHGHGGAPPATGTPAPASGQGDAPGQQGGGPPAAPPAQDPGPAQGQGSSGDHGSGQGDGHQNLQSPAASAASQPTSDGASGNTGGNGNAGNNGNGHGH